MLALDPIGQHDFIMAAVAWLRRRSHLSASSVATPAYIVNVRVRDAVTQAMRTGLKFSEDDLAQMLDWVADERIHFSGGGVPQIITALKNYRKTAAISPQLVAKIQRLIERLGVESGGTAQAQKWIAQLNEIAGLQETNLPLEPGETWADAALDHLRALPPAQHTAWAGLLAACFNAGGSAPQR